MRKHIFLAIASALLMVGVTLLILLRMTDDGTRGSATIGMRGLFESIESGAGLSKRTQSDVLESYGKPSGAVSTLNEDGEEFSVWMYEYENQLMTYYFRGSTVYGVHYSKFVGAESRWLTLDRDLYNQYLDLTLTSE